MRKLLFLFFLLLPLVLAAAPPTLESHQFQGTVKWNAPDTYTLIKAELNEKNYTSLLRDLNCNAATCTATYGKAQDTILSVQGQAGNTIRFYVDTLLARTYTFSPDTVTVLDIDLTLPLPANLTPSNLSSNATNAAALSCTTSWQCAAWSACTNATRMRACNDTAQCNPDLPTRNETEVCGQNTTNTTRTPVVCEYNWQCTTWSSCLNSQQQRSCERTDNCDAIFAAGEATSLISKPQPLLLQSCLMQEPSPTLTASCFDGIQNQNETGVDCGGSCAGCGPAAQLPTALTPWYYYAIPIAILVLLGGLATLYYFKHKSSVDITPAVHAQLQNYFQRNIQRGLSKEQITENLIKGGWEKKTIQRFLKENTFE